MHTHNYRHDRTIPTLGITLLFSLLLWQGQTVENPFTDPTQDSPTLSIGQPLGTIQEISEAGNPFKQSEQPPSMWEMEKQQLTAAVTLLAEQLTAETAARIESQVGSVNLCHFF